MPVKKSAEFDCAEGTFVLKERPALHTDETIAYYQTASYLYKNQLYRALTREEHADYTRRAERTAPLAKSGE